MITGMSFKRDGIVVEKEAHGGPETLLAGGYEEDTASRNFLAEPELHQLAAQVLCRQHIERGKRLVHEQDFRLHRQGSRKSCDTSVVISPNTISG